MSMPEGNSHILVIIAVVLVSLPATLIALCCLLAPFLRGPEDTFVLSVSRLINTIYCRTWHQLKMIGANDCIPESGPFILVANHTSGADPMLVGYLTKRWIHYLMAREYYATFGLHWYFNAMGAIPVNRDGNDLRATRSTLRLLKEGKGIGIFPQGGIRDPEELEEADAAKMGAAMFALWSGAPLIPVYIKGAPAFDSIVLGVICPSRSRLYVGNPLTFKGGGKKPSREEIEAASEKIIAAIRKLKEEAEAPKA